ncbi:MAG TPA: hypothetical protein VNO79_04665, partial [Actinomycetota bacterium]|nr:hypothetical protein [Actinomycetota bacterium]
ANKQTAEAEGKVEGWKDAIRDAAKEAGIARDDVRELAGALRGLPRSVRVRILLNTSQAYQDWLTFVTSLNAPLIARLIALGFTGRVGGATSPGGGGGGADGGGGSGSRQQLGAEAGAIVGAQIGAIVRRPVVVAGEGHRLSRFGAGAEAIVPLDARGIAILAEALTIALRRVSWPGVEEMRAAARAIARAAAEPRPLVLDRRRFLRQADYEGLARGW